MPVKAGYLLAAGGGAILLYSGLKGKAWTSTLKNVISGKPITKATDYPITTAPAAFDSTGVAASGANVGQSSSVLAQDALSYVGHWTYVWGGAPGSGTRGDCSSFMNAVIGRDNHLAIPLYKAGAYHGQSHGPPTTVWLVWTGCFTIHRNDAGPGDLAVWQTHMGMFTDNGHVVSALDPADGVKNLLVHEAAPFGEILVCRRLKAVTAHG